MATKNQENHYKEVSFWFFLLPPVGWFAVFMLLPLGILWLFSFGETNNNLKVDIVWTFTNYIDSIQPIYLDVLLTSVLFSLATTLVCLVIGFFVALFISFSSPKMKMFWLVLIVLPFWTNILIRVFGISTLLSNRGLINVTIEYFWNRLQIFENSIGLTSFFSAYYEPIDMLFNYGAVLVGMVYVSLPFMILPIYSSLDKLDVSYLEASLDLGASQTRTVIKVMLPMIKSGIGFGIFLTFIPSLSTFLIPEMLGGPNNQMIANVVQRQFGAGNNWPLGSALSFILMYITFVVFFINYFNSRSKN